jgi:hypothetical protein
MDTSAPKWTDVISNNVLCGYFYVFFVIISVLAAISLMGGIVIFATSKMSVGMLFATLFNVVISFGVSTTSALFLYLICERALKPMQVQNANARAGPRSDYTMM